MKRGIIAARFGLLLALSLVLSYLESLVPLSFSVPGVKLGLPNLVIVFALYKLGKREAIILSLLRVLLATLLFGNILTMLYSASGAIFSFLAMCGLQSSGKFGCTGVSVAGAVAHNCGQILAAVLLLETSRLAWYLPVLCVSGVVAGICIGLLSALLIRRIKIN